MNFQYSIEARSLRHAELQKKMMSNMEKLGTSLQSPKPIAFDFEKLNTVLSAYEEVNSKIIASKESSEHSFFNTKTGRAVHVVFDIGAIFVGLGTAGLGLYAESTDPVNTDNTLLLTTLSGSAALIGKGVKDLWKNYNDYKATLLARQEPIQPEKVTRIREIAERIDKIIHLTGPEAKAALEEYQRIYPSLPSRIKKILPDPENWDAALVAKIHDAVSPMLESEDDSSVEKEGETQHKEHRIDIEEEGSDEDV